MLSPEFDRTFLISAGASNANLLHRARMPWILEHLCDLWLWDVLKFSTLVAPHGLGPCGFLLFGVPCRKRTLFLVGNVDGRDLHHIARKCAGAGRRCNVSGENIVYPKASASRSEVYSSRDNTRLAPFISALAMILTMNERRFQRSHPLKGMGSSLNASKAIGMGVTDLAPIVNQSQ